MQRSATAGADSSPKVSARAYPAAWRAVAAAFVAVSRGSLPLILLLLLTATDPPVTPPLLVRLLFVFTLLPGLAAWLVGRAFAADLEIETETLVLRRRELQIEVPLLALARIVPWKVPLPGSGFSLWMRSGRRLRYGLQCADPAALLARLADAGVAAARPAMHHPSLLYASAKRSRGRRRWYHWMARFGVFALLPTALLFNAHQHIAYGGLLGEYYLLGLASYLRTFAIYWGTLTIYLVLYASALRGLAEGVALLTAWVAPAHSSTARRAAEIGCQALYYGGVPVVLALRFLA